MELAVIVYRVELCYYRQTNRDSYELFESGAYSAKEAALVADMRHCGLCSSAQAAALRRRGCRLSVIRLSWC